MSNFNSQINRYLNQYLLEQSQDYNVVGIFPGAFKPPHNGHFQVALQACNSCDNVYVFVSNKERPLVKQPSTKKKTEMPDIARYNNIFNSDKYTSNLMSVDAVDPIFGETSATIVRKAIELGDVETVKENLPDEIGNDKDKVVQILLDNQGTITIDHTMAIWDIYKKYLIQNSNLNDENINIQVAIPSPVKDTYDLVDELNKSEDAGKTVVKLYVGGK
jgi:cytidyltransferase-like protein